MLRTLFNILKRTFPNFFRILFNLRDWVKTIPARLKLLWFRKKLGGLAVAYLSPRFPQPPASRTEFAHGGAVKLTYLAEHFPHQFPSANLIYAVSSVAHPLQMEILKAAKHHCMKVVVNQNGVAFPAWAGEKYTTYNEGLKDILDHSDYIVYQSLFCKIGAHRYLFPQEVPSEIIYNPIDLVHFSHRGILKKKNYLTMLLGGNQFQQYRLELAFQTLYNLIQFIPNSKLIVTGKLWGPRNAGWIWARHTMQEFGISDHVNFIGQYTQETAPAIYSQADLLLHTQYADASPGLVAEALACGLPVVHLDNGGVPELVGDAGIGVHVEHDWNKINLPNPQAMADAVIQVYAHREEFSQMARQRAVDLFSLEKFVAKHKEIFEKVLNS